MFGSLGILDSGQKIVTSGLSMHLDAAQKRSYPGTGTTWTDLSGNGKNGTFAASPKTPTFNSDNGGSVVFNGLGQYVSIGVGTGVNQFGTGNFTVTGWIRRAASPSGGGNIIGDYYTGSTENTGEWQILSGISGGIVTFFIYRVGFGYLWLGQSTGIATDTWFNFAVTRVGTTVTIYINGSTVGSTVTDSGSWGTATGNLNLGIDGDNTIEAFPGRIAIMMVYKSTGLSSTQVLQNYNAVKSRFGL